MKSKNVFIGMFMMSAILAFVSCSESTDDPSGYIEGIYYGSFTRTTSLKSTAETVRHGYSGDAFAEVRILEDSQIQVHCYGQETDTTFMVDYYLTFTGSKEQ